MKSDAFTLIELLVVIAILAILTSIASPAIGSMIERGRSAKCVGNLRQIDVAGPNTLAQHGSSYHFSPVLQDELASNVNIYGRRGIFQVPNVGRLTVCTDYQAVHASSGKLGMNVLKADGRVIQR